MIYNIKYITQDHKNIFWCWLGIGIISPKDGKIHHKSCQSRGKKLFNIYFCNRIHHKTTRKSCGGGWVSKYFHFHHKTSRKSCGGGWVSKYFHSHHKTTRKSCGGVGVLNIFIFTTRPQDSPQEFSI